MKRATQIVVSAMLLLIFVAHPPSAVFGRRPKSSSQFDRPVQIIDPQNPNAPARFAWVDAWIDPHGQPLAAYQFELKSSGGGAVTLVGVEGGEHPAFTPPPYYDAKANVQKRIVIAGFNTGDDLPHTRTRVARVMVQIKGNPTWSVKLEVAASNQAKPIEADVSLSEGAAQ